jgi:serine/threonine protein kinase
MNKYKIGSKIGSGADGIIYEAINKNSEEVIIKKSLSKFKEGFITNEYKMAKIAGDLNLGPKVLDYFIDIYAYTVFEKINGITLKDYKNIFGHVEEKVLLKIMNKINIMHGNNISHGDLQPQNIMISINNVSKKCLELIYKNKEIDNICKFLNFHSNSSNNNKLILSVYLSVLNDVFDISIIDYANSEQKKLSKEDKEEDLDLLLKNEDLIIKNEYVNYDSNFYKQLKSSSLPTLAKKIELDNNLSRDNIKHILKNVVDMNDNIKSMTIDDESIELIQKIFKPLNDKLNNSANVELFISDNIQGEYLNEMLLKLWKNKKDKYLIIDAIIEHILELAYNGVRDDKRDVIDMIDIIKVIKNDEELLSIFKKYLPLFIHDKPILDTNELPKKGEEPIPYNMFKDFIDDLIYQNKNNQLSDIYIKGLKNLMLAIALYYYIPQRNQKLYNKKSNIDVSNDILKLKKLTKRELMYEDNIYNIIYLIINAIIDYSSIIKPDGKFTYNTLINSVILNPYLKDIPISKIIEKFSKL